MKAMGGYDDTFAETSSMSSFPSISGACRVQSPLQQQLRLPQAPSTSATSSCPSFPRFSLREIRCWTERREVAALAPSPPRHRVAERLGARSRAPAE